MKKLLLLLSLLFVGTSWIVAQDSSYPAGQSPATGETTVQGCLSGSNGNFTLTDQHGNSYKLAGDTAKLSEHVGHQVKVTGTAESASSPSAGASTGTSANGASRTLQVSSIKHISKTCENGGMSK